MTAWMKRESPIRTYTLGVPPSPVQAPPLSPKKEHGNLLSSALSRVDRSKFVAPSVTALAHKDLSLDIGFNQVSGKPSVILQMLLQLPENQKGRVLEIGCGTGYVLALLDTLGFTAYGMEIIPALAQKGRKLLDSFHHHRVLVHNRDGLAGWKDHAPYEAILVSTPVARLEPQLLLQLHPEGGKVIALFEESAETKTSKGGVGYRLFIGERRGSEIHPEWGDLCDFTG